MAGRVYTPAEYRALLVTKPAAVSSSRSKKATVTIGGVTFFARSPWEANIAAYYEMLRVSGEITRWEHEPDTFWFDSIKRGVRSYLPDFKITRSNGSVYYVEVKGYMDSKSLTKLKRMAKYHPTVEVQLIDKTRYAEIKKTSKNIKGWGLM
jgi:hypothetical protein